MTAPGLRAVTARLQQVLPAGAVVRVGVEAAGHYHRPLLSGSAWPPGWQVLELNPAHVTEQRRVRGRRGIKTDAVDLEAMTDLLLAGQGVPVGAQDTVVIELAAWAAHRARRVHARAGLKNQLLGQLDRSFPGLTLALPDVLGTKAGRLVAAEFADPARLAALGVTRFTRFAAARGLAVRRGLAERLVTAARDALPTVDATAARQVLAADMALLASLDAQVTDAEAELARLLPASPYATLTSVPGWGVVRAAAYGAARGDPGRWPGPVQVYRAAGLSPAAVRVRPQAPRRRHQPRGQRRAPPRPDRPGHRAVALRPGRENLRRRAAGTRQARRHHRLRTRTAPTASPSPWSAIRHPTTRPAGRSRRSKSGRFTTPAGDARLERRRAGPDAETAMAGAHARHAVSSLAPGPSPLRQPERRQLTQPERARGRINQRGRPGHRRSPTAPPAKEPPPAPRRGAAKHAQATA